MGRPGTVLGGRYRLEERLGRGGMGEVWAAYDQALGRQVAVKILLTALDFDQELTARLRQEARTAAALAHPGITVVHDIGEHDGHPYFVMELLSGSTFAALLTEHGGALPVELAVELMARIAEALAYAHSRGVVHRDIKPENLMEVSGGVKICDFGIAHFAEASARFTRTGTAVGTPAFMAPEQWRGEPVDARTDLYAFGATLCLLLTAAPPFPGPTYPAYAHQHLTNPPPRVPGVPVALDELVQRLLAKDPADRPASAGEVQTALNEIRAGLASTVRTGDTTVRQPPPGDGTWVAPMTITNSVGARMWSSMTVYAQVAAWLVGVLLAVFSACAKPGDQLIEGETWWVNAFGGLLIGLAGGAVIGAILGAFAGRKAESDVIALDSEKLAITHKVVNMLDGHFVEATMTLTVGWDAIDRIAVDGEARDAKLVVWFLPTRRPSGEWLKEHHVAPPRDEDDGFVVYGPAGHSPEKVPVARLRELLRRYAGESYNRTKRIPDP